MAEHAGKPLRFRNALRVKAAECWLAIGRSEDALQELSHIPAYARHHPDVLRVRGQLSDLPAPLVEIWLGPGPGPPRRRAS